jgi:Co/Zn/Cd efflux system component
MSCCPNGQKFDGASVAYRRALWAVILINLVMFFVEITAGFASGSQALKADALDFAGDTLTYAISLFVIGSTLAVRARAALFKGGLLIVIATSVLGMTLMRALSGEPPVAETMGIVGFAALLANLASVFILLKWRDGDANVRSVWLCSRNDAIGNVGVMTAGGLVAITGSAWPDLIVAFVLAGLFTRSAWSICNQALAELRNHKQAGAETGDA